MSSTVVFKAIISAAFILSTGIPPVKASVIERGEVVALNSRLEYINSGKKLRLKVIVFDSFRKIGKPKRKIEGSSLNVQLPLKYWDSSQKLAGETEILLDLPPEIKNVTLGKNRVEIWPVDRGFSSDELKILSIAMDQYQKHFPEKDLFLLTVSMKRPKKNIDKILDCKYFQIMISGRQASRSYFIDQGSLKIVSVLDDKGKQLFQY